MVKFLLLENQLNLNSLGLLVCFSGSAVFFPGLGGVLKLQGTEEEAVRPYTLDQWSPE